MLPLLRYCLPVIDKISRIAMNQFCILNYFSTILALPEIQNTSIVICETCFVVVSIGLMYTLHGCYCSPTGRSKLAHHAIFTVRPVIMVHVRCLMIYGELLSCYSCN